MCLNISVQMSKINGISSPQKDYFYFMKCDL